MKHPSILTHQVFLDNRGYFTEVWKGENKYIQGNVSVSVKNTVRGLHFQMFNPQEKYLTVLMGRIIDVIIDLRKDSSEFLKYYEFDMSVGRNNSLIVPAGFAHGFWALEDSIVLYRCDHVWHKESDGGINPFIGYDFPWLMKRSELIVSDKDNGLPTINEWLNMDVDFVMGER